MPLRRFLLRIMLWSLAFAAVAGVGAVLLSSGDLVWRIVGTGITTAVACGLLMPASMLVDREKSRSAGLLGMAAVILEFVMILMLIWDVPGQLWGARLREEGLIGTPIFFGLAAILAMYLLRQMHEPRHAAAARTGLVMVGATLTACLTALWLPYSSGLDEHWWETTGALGLTGGLAVLGLIGSGGDESRPWRWVGIAASAAAGCMWLFDIWVGSGSDPGFVIFCVLVTVGAVVALSNLAFLGRLAREQRWVRIGTIAVAILTGGFIDLLIINDKLFDVGVPEDLLARLSAAGGIVTGCGALALCVLARLNRKVDYEMLSPELVDMVVVCPRCSKKQSVCIGDSTCSGCRLRISIRLEEPRCPKCDYLLYRLTSDRCPECGTAIGAGAEPATVS